MLVLKYTLKLRPRMWLQLSTCASSRVELANTHAWPMNVGTPMTFEYQFVFQLDTASVEYTAVYQVDTDSPGVPQGQLPYDAFPPKARQSCTTLLVRSFTLFQVGRTVALKSLSNQ